MQEQRKVSTGLLILVIAGTGEGKTTKVKNLIKGRPCLVFDVNGEYEDLEYDVNLPRSRYYNSDISKFVDIVPTKHGGTAIVFEEATNFFAGSTQKHMKQIIVGKRHPEAKGGRNLIFVFHTINSVPPFILDTADIICLGKTRDEEGRVKQKSRKLLAPFQRLQREPKYTFYNIKNT